MAISNVIEKLGRTIFEAPFGESGPAKDTPEIAEIRLAILDAIKAKSHRAGGKTVFPYNLIRVELLGVPDSQAPLFRSGFLASYFGNEMKKGLARSGYRFPEDLALEVETTSELPAAGGNWLRVETALREPTVPDAAAVKPKPGRLIVIHGSGDKAELLLEKPRTNIGRDAEVYRGAGPLRRNDLAFIGDDEASRSVSREHAHITFSAPAKEYRLFNDRSYKGDANCALWIVRGGLSQPVHHTARGTLLESGDEIHLGAAIVQFVVD